MGIKQDASQEDINKAYRKKSKLLHPDKAKQSFIASKARPTKKPGQKPGVHVSKAPSEKEIRKALQEASDRFARLGLIASILRGSGRERYDHFLNNGFPKWRGTGYYYARFRPGLGSTLLGLFVFGGGLAHYGALILSWKRQREFVERYIRQARKAAWGDESGIMAIPGLDADGGVPASSIATGAEDEPVLLNRKQKRQQERESKKGKENKRSRSAKRSGTSTPLESNSTGPQGAKKRVQAENGKVLLVDSVGNVYLEEDNEDGVREEYLLDSNEIIKPTFRSTVLYRLPVWAYTAIKNRLLRPGTEKEGNAVVDEDGSSGSENEEKAATAEIMAPSNLSAASRRKKTGKIRR